MVARSRILAQGGAWPAWLAGRGAGGERRCVRTDTDSFSMLCAMVSLPEPASSSISSARVRGRSSRRAAVRTERTPWLTGVPARTARGARLRPGVGRVIPGAAGAVPSGAFSATVSSSSLPTRARRAGAPARAYDLRLPCHKCLSSPPWAGPNSPRACRRVWRPAAVV